MPDQTLLTLLDEVRGKTLRLLDGLTDAQARWAPSGLHNSILWHAGHSYATVEFLTLGAVGEERQMPEGWWELFSFESKPATIAPERWPPLHRVVEKLKAQRDRLRLLIEALPAERLAGPAHPSFNRPDRTVRYCILHGLHDEACHSGEIWLLRKLQGIPKP